MAYTIDDMIKLCSDLAGSDGDYPFGDQPICFRVGGKIFAEIYPERVKGALAILKEDKTISPDESFPMITFKCNPDFKDFMRQVYPDSVFRAYHVPAMQQPYAFTVLLNGIVSDNDLLLMADQAYQRVFHSLPKKIQKQILADNIIVETCTEQS